MSDSIIMERVSDAMALRKCLERFDAELRDNMPAGWSAHERAGHKDPNITLGIYTHVNMDQQRVAMDTMQSVFE